MNRINRVTSILIQLQSKKIIPAKEIAQRFNISLRTVYRDIRTLEEAGIPIGVNSGPTATYARTFSHGITDF